MPLPTHCVGQIRSGSVRHLHLRLRVRLRVATPEWLVRLMLRLGAAGRVEEPGELADRVADAARAALANYR